MASGRLLGTDAPKARGHALAVRQKEPEVQGLGFAAPVEGDQLLPRHQHEATRINGVDLVADEQSRESPKQPLEVISRSKARRLHRHQRGIIAQHDSSCPVH